MVRHITCLRFNSGIAPKENSTGELHRTSMGVKLDPILNMSILRILVEDMLKTSQFRDLLNDSFKSNSDPAKTSEVLEQMITEVDPMDAKSKKQLQDAKQQVMFISKCLNEGTLPLPIVKKIKYRSLVLENYQINEKVAKAFGESLQLLGDSIDSIVMSNNNMNDES